MSDYIEPDYSGDEVPFDSPLEDDDELDDFPMDDDDEKEIDEELSKKQNELNEQYMSNSPFQAPSWGSTTGQQSTPFGGTSQPTFPWSTPSTQASTSPWAPAASRVQPVIQQPQMLVPTTAIRIERPKKHIIVDMFDGIIESWSSEGKPNIPPRALYDIKLKFDAWNAIASFSPQFVYTIVPEVSNEDWNIGYQYVVTSLASYLRLPIRNCPIITQGISGQRKEDTLRKILQFIPKEEHGRVVYVGIYSGYYNLGNEDLIAAKHCEIEYADIYQLLKGEI